MSDQDAKPMTAREYTLLLTRTQKLAIWMPLVMFTLIPFIFLSLFYADKARGNTPENVPPFFPLLPLGAFFAVALYFAWSVLTLPRKISVTRDRQLVFKSTLRSRSVRVADVLSIEPRSLNIQVGLSGYLLKYRDGKLRFPGQFTGQYQLLYELKQANPSVDLKGC